MQIISTLQIVVLQRLALRNILNDPSDGSTLPAGLSLP